MTPLWRAQSASPTWGRAIQHLIKQQGHKRHSSLLRGGLSLCLAFSLIGCTGFARQVLYRPDTQPVTVSTALNPPSMVTAHTADGLTLKGYFWPGRTAHADIIVFLHGRNWTASRAAETARPLAGQGEGLLVASYRGFDDNPGRPSEAGLIHDAEAFVRLAAQLGGPESRIWLVGHSLGAAVALHAAESHPRIAGLFLFSAFAQLTDAVPKIARSLVPDRWNNLEAITKLRQPVVILQGGRDRFIPANSGAALFDSTRGPASLIVGTMSRHNPDFAVLSSWMHEAVASMAAGNLANLPPPPANWIEVVRRP